ncbi:hypothetical protein L1F30_15525 [Simiduia sp. 21SJ11W-1]|uniref:hypothetical protein n=1 Tax=Simiduia sp. 21SJ11W-1 TaxID=2909669 RepID=UPI0020A0EE74|nr:hypothetical protein [Simiduia sp. 21SJ11W-1]UTA47551.1 hypothetical protein L1F30_15525 [Simiduia sp. 21SJ11W-1]
MSSDETLAPLLGRLKLPAQTLEKLGFCHGTKAADVKAWAESLPATRVSFTSVQLYTALPDIARLKIDPINRLEMLEGVRPYVQQCIQGLGRNFLNQPIILPEGAVKTAIVAQALQKHLTNSYLVVVRDLAKSKPKASQLAQFDLALQRAMNGLALMVMRGYQLYTPVPNGVWVELHTLYQIAKLYEREHSLVADNRLEYVPAMQLEHTYLRALLLACARPNQMRQQEVQHTFDALELWVPLVDMHAEASDSRLFAVDPHDDIPPVYKDRLHANDPAAVFELGLEELVTALRRQLEIKDEDNAIVRIPNNMPSQLVEHLCASWSVMRQRAFERRLTQGELQVTVGMINLHYHSASELEFADFLSRHDTSAPKATPEAEEDPFANSASAGAFGALPTMDFIEDWDEDAEDEIQIAPVHHIKIVDTSPGGYCLNWNVDSMEKLRAGDLIGVREPGRLKWAVAAVRWIRQAGGTTELGVQVIAPHAQPSAVSMLQVTGEKTPYMRALKIQQLKSVNQPATIITDNLPFVEYCKVRVRDAEGEGRYQLTKRLFATGSFSQFTYRVLDAGKQEKKGATQGQEDYSSVWKDK